MAAKYKKHVKKEEERLYEALQEIDPATSDYGMAQSQWEHTVNLLDREENDSKERGLKWWHIGLMFVATIATPFVLEGSRKIAESPDTVDLAKKFMGNNMPKPKL